MHISPIFSCQVTKIDALTYAVNIHETHMHVCVRACVRAHTHTHTHAHTHAHAHMQTHTQTQMLCINNKETIYVLKLSVSLPSSSSSSSSASSPAAVGGGATACCDRSSLVGLTFSCGNLSISSSNSFNYCKINKTKTISNTQTQSKRCIFCIYIQICILP